MLDLRFLGPPRVSREGERVTAFVTNKALALFVYLSLNEGHHSRRVLAGLLWGGVSAKRARRSLRVVLHNLRQLFPEYLAVTRKRVAFVHEQPVRLDVTAFEALAGQNELDALVRAAALYRGSFLEGLSVEGEAAFQVWLRGEQERLRLLLLQVLERLAEQYVAGGCWSEAEETMRRLLALEPWSEVAHRQLMLLLARQGAYGAALAQYEQCRALLEAELGLHPMPETEALQRRIRRLRTTPRHNLPAPTDPIVGREPDLAALGALLRDEAVRLVTITGLGGVGKTQLAAAAAARQRAFFLDGLWWAPLAGITDARVLPAALLTALGVERAGDVEPEAQLLDFLRDREMLLVLDNFEHLLGEHVLAGTGFLTEILQTAPAVKLLVTSRVPLKLQAEHVYPLSGLPFSTWTTVAEAQAQPGVRLFLEHARRVSPSFTLREEDLAALQRLVELTEGLPLALIMAAGFAKVLRPGEIAAEIAGSLDFLEAAHRDVPLRQRSMRAIFEAAWERLGERERDLFAALSLFRGFTLAAARAVTAAAGLGTLSPRDLARLAERSLVAREGEGRFDLHELLRQFAGERLEGAGRAEAVRDAHADHYMGALARLLPALKGKDQLGAVAAIEADFANIRRAWRSASVRGRWEHFPAASQSLCLFSLFRSRHFEGIDLFQYALQGGERQQPAYPYLLAGCKFLERQAGLTEEALSSVPELRALIDRPGDPHAQRYCRLVLGLMLASHGEPEEALALLAGVEAEYHDKKDHFYTAVALWRSGLVYDRAGQVEPARNTYQRGLEMAQEGGDRYVASVLSNNLGTTLWRQEGAGEAAESYFQTAARLTKELGANHWYAYILGILSRLRAARAGDLAAGRALLEEALSVPRAHDVAWVRAGLLLTLALSHWFEREYEQVLALTHEVLALGKGARAGRPRAIILRAVAHHALGEHEKATELAKQWLEGTAKDPPGGKQDDFFPYIGLLLAERGANERAVEALAYGLSQFGADAGAAFDPHIARLRAELEERLGSERFAAAWERGEGLDAVAIAGELLEALEGE